MTRALPVVLLTLLLAACASTSTPPDQRHPDDPWEPFNRSVYGFNRGVDRAIVRPIAKGYTALTPKPAQRGIRNFFRNLASPIVMANLLLQGRPGDFEDEFQRFFVNSVYGIGGLFDVASAGGIEDHDADFGQTLATWGWHDSRFLMLPMLGPSTVRDGWGIAADSVADIPWREAVDRGTYALLGLRIIETRAGLLPLDAELARAFDEYLLVRDGWLQRRNYYLFGENAGLPDYDAWLDEDLEE